MELNEYLSESRRRRERRQNIIWRVFISTIIFLVVALLVWLIGWSPILRMNAIVVQGNASVSSDEVVALVNMAYTETHHGFGLLSPKNMLAWSTAVPADVLAKEPQILTMTLAKNYGSHEIVATITERQPFAIWCDIAKAAETSADASSTPPGSVVVAAMAVGNESCYWFDRAGTLFAQTFDTAGDLLFAIHDYSGRNPVPGQPILPDRFTPNLLSILSVVRQSGLRLKEIRLNDIGLEEIQVTTYDGPDIYFSLRFPADDTLTILHDIMAKPGFGKLQYVDFRTEGRAYYR